MENLKRALSFGGILGEGDIEEITADFTVHHLKPGQHFITPGEVSGQLAFVDEGVFRIYVTNDEQEEATRYFMRKNQFMMDIDCFYNHRPAESGVQAVTEARLLITQRDEWLRSSERIPKLFILTKTLTEMALINKIKDNDFLHFGTAKQRYLEFMKRYPDLALSVPQQYIASYLQITPQSLSRIRREAVNHHP
ncbi:Crp/Fnr family transcriptional regulator [Mucilaginibacter pedocola]|uniref:Cyclic nucleotide-binding domain-containing protein n=1 Tax=Mucilaginibacter pedocola TaxID=1792845 RepID=A0A1S9PL48_9SPHI|nr:Crp/Fnr family transcriptional regulator [Mucilaginibacter pedocola]OOQ61692.1 hypothetical protein BC343_01055 [Mucilaginibacter pedocola]